MSQTAGDAMAGRRAAIIGGLLGLIPALGLGILRVVNDEPFQFKEQLAGDVVFALILVSPFLLALVAAKISNPAARGALLLALGILSLVAVFSTLSGVTVVLLPACIALFIAAVRSLKGAGGQMVWAPLFLIPGLLGAAAIGFGFFALFGIQADEPRCWSLTEVEGREEWKTLAVPATNATGGITMGPFGPEIRRSLCSSDIITNQEAAIGLGVAGTGILLIIAISWLPLARKRKTT